MPEFLLHYSGIVAIFIAWVFLIVPLIFSHIDPRKETVTSVAGKNKLVRFFVTSGLMGGALMQAVFIFYVADRFLLSVWSLGCLLYLTANIATIMVGFFTFDRHPKIHTFFTRYYFFAMPLAFLVIGTMLQGSYPVLYNLSLTLVAFYSVGQFLLYQKYKVGNVLMEGWGFVILSIWTLVMTFA